MPANCWSGSPPTSGAEVLDVHTLSLIHIFGPNTPGIVPLSPQTEGVENVVFNNYSIGTNTNELKQTRCV